MSLKQNDQKRIVGILPFDIDLAAVPVSSFFYPLRCMIICFILFYMQNRAVYLPSVSEAGTEEPNTIIFSYFMFNGGLSVGVTLFLYHKYLKMIYSLSKGLSKTLTVLTILSYLGASALGRYPHDEEEVKHYVWSAIGFPSILVFEIIVTIYTFRDETVCMNLWRLLLIIVSVIGVISHAFGEDIFPSLRYCLTLGSIGEWTCLNAMMLIMLSWFKPFEELQLSLAIVE